MLPKKERLNRADFSRFFAVGTRHHSSLFTLIYSADPQFHASIVVAKKAERSAVRRNKLRRRSYDILRRYQRVTGTNGIYILITKKPATTASYEVLKNDLQALVGRINKMG